ASKVADRVGVTRSVIVNALRKLGSAGIIESRSLGMKGTYIKVTSRLFLEELGISSEIAEQTSLPLRAVHTGQSAVVA
ncbi:MAG: hypothetical protein LBS53_12550, partial [Synergistaceae bacterium]|nr:hypothetical protein [Synergistaceae bacterium]